MKNHNQKPTLKPCPFCGGEAQLNSVDAGHSVSCFECGVETFFIKERNCDYTGESKDVAITSWQTRPEPTEAQIRAGGKLFKEFRSQFDRDHQQAANLIYNAMQSTRPGPSEAQIEAAAQAIAPLWHKFCTEQADVLVDGKNHISFIQELAEAALQAAKDAEK